MSRGACAQASRPERSALKRPRRRGGLLLAASASGALLLMAPSAATAEPVSTSPPVISGTLEAGQALTASTGTWSDASPIVSYAYQWLRCIPDFEEEGGYACTDIDYATANPYTLPWGFADGQAEVTVTATDAQGESNFATSGVTDVISPGPRYTVGESVSGNGSVTGFATDPEAAGKTADSNLACPGACGARYSYLPGTEVELSATPVPGSTFLGWGGACSGSAPTCSFTLGASGEVTATFSGQATSSVPALGSEGRAGQAQPPSAGAPGMGAWEPSPPSVASLAARLTSIHYRRRHIWAGVRCQEARPCRLSLAIFTGASTGQVMIARRFSFTVPARRSASVSLALDGAGERIFARRRRLPVMARLMLNGAGRLSVVEQGRFTLTG
jgi:hypothetical protein